MPQLHLIFVWVAGAAEATTLDTTNLTAAPQTNLEYADRIGRVICVWCYWNIIILIFIKILLGHMLENILWRAGHCFPQQEAVKVNPLL